MKTRQQLVPYILAHLLKPNGDRIYMLPLLNAELRHGDCMVYDGTICEFRLAEIHLTPEEAELAMEIWVNGQ